MQGFFIEILLMEHFCYLWSRWRNIQKISNSDKLEINIENNEIKNITKNETYAMKPFSEIIAQIISAGGLFKYKKWI